MIMNIFVISLSDSQERRRNIIQEFSRLNLDFNFFDAVRGDCKKSPLFTDYDYTKRLWLTSGKYPTKGEIGCYASHYSLWLKCIELNQPIIVFEDDVLLSNNAKLVCEMAISQIRHYGFLRLEPLLEGDGGVSHLVDKNKDFEIRLMKNNYGGTRVYCISPKAASKLIKHRWCFPVDCFIGANYIHKQISYCMSPSAIASHDNFASTVQTKIKKASIFHKFTRELYTGYKKFRLLINFIRNKRKTHDKL